MICDNCGKKYKRAPGCNICIECSSERERQRGIVRRASAKAVKESITKGILKPATKYRCVDCGARASCYDHRDYRKPNDVEPVCKRCDANRGSGKPWAGCDEAWVVRAMAFEKNRKIVKRWYFFKGNEAPPHVVGKPNKR